LSLRSPSDGLSFTIAGLQEVCSVRLLAGFASAAFYPFPLDPFQFCNSVILQFGKRPIKSALEATVSPHLAGGSVLALLTAGAIWTIACPSRHDVIVGLLMRQGLVRQAT
jgi:hypothetical protein